MPGLYTRLREALRPSPAELPAEQARRASESALRGKLAAAERRLAESLSLYDNILGPFGRMGYGDPLEQDAGGWGDRGGYGGMAGRAGARKDGGDWPLLTTMQDLAIARGQSRWVCESNSYAAGFVDRSVDFIIGDGHQPKVTERGAAKGAVSTGVADRDGDGTTDANPAVERVVDFIDDFRELNSWGIGEEDREEEGFRRSIRDAEVCVRFFAGGADSNGVPRVRWVEPEQIDAPPGAGPNERWGWRTEEGDVETRLAAYIRDLDNAAGDGEWVAAEKLVWHKLGTDRTVLRGYPSFYLVAEAFEQCEKINKNLADVVAIQAQIAYIRQHAAGTLPGQITTFVDGQSDYQQPRLTPRGGTDKTNPVRWGDSGQVVDMSAGMMFQAGPASTGIPGFVQGLQSRLRQICARFGYPEFFTGDASNANLASILVTGGPFERNVRRRSRRYAAFQAEVYKRACRYAVASGRLQAADLAVVEITVTPPGVTMANKLEEAQVDQILIQNKIKSPQTAMAERGLDAHVEMANIQALDDAHGSGGGTDFGGGDDGGELFGPAAEGYTPDEYELLSEADRSHLRKEKRPDKNGVMRTVWVRAGEDPKAVKKAAKVQGKSDRDARVKAALGDPLAFTPATATQFVVDLRSMTNVELKSLKAELGLGKSGSKSRKEELVVGVTAFAVKQHMAAAVARYQGEPRIAAAKDHVRSQVKSLAQAAGRDARGAEMKLKMPKGATAEEYQTAVKELIASGELTQVGSGVTPGPKWGARSDMSIGRELLTGLNPLNILKDYVAGAKNAFNFLERKIFGESVREAEGADAPDLAELVDAWRAALVQALADDDHDGVAALLALVTEDDDDHVAESYDPSEYEVGLHRLLYESGSRTPPRPGLVWKDSTKRWVKADQGTPDGKPKPAAKADDKGAAKQHVADMLADPSKVTPENLPGLHASLSKLTVPELKEVAKSLKEKVGGTKAALAERIVAAAKAKAPAKAQSYQDKLAALAAEHPDEHAAHMASLKGDGKPAADTPKPEPAAKPAADKTASTKTAKAPPEHVAKIAADVKRLHDTAVDADVTPEDIDDGLKVLDTLDKAGLIEVAKGVNAASGMQSMSKTQAVDEIKKAVKGMHGSARRAFQGDRAEYDRRFGPEAVAAARVRKGKPPLDAPADKPAKADAPKASDGPMPPSPGVPPVKEGVAPDAAVYQKAWDKAGPQDPARAQQVKDTVQASYKHLTQFAQFQHGRVEIRRIYHQAKKTAPDMSVEEFHRNLLELSKDRKIELHVLNEVKEAQDKELSIERDGRSLYYVIADDDWKTGEHAKS